MDIQSFECLKFVRYATPSGVPLVEVVALRYAETTKNSCNPYDSITTRLGPTGRPSFVATRRIKIENITRSLTGLESALGETLYSWMTGSLMAHAQLNTEFISDINLSGYRSAAIALDRFHIVRDHVEFPSTLSIVEECGGNTDTSQPKRFILSH